MKRTSVFLDVMVRRFVRAGRHRISRLRGFAALTRSSAGSRRPTLPPTSGRIERPTGQDAQRESPVETRIVRPDLILRSGRDTSRYPLRARIAGFLLAVVFAYSASAGVREVGAIGLTVNDLGRELNFYTNTLPFELVSVSETSGREQDRLFGLKHVKLRTATLRLGDERIVLTEHLLNKGRPIPADSRSFDHWFQHVAIVVSDMDKAYERLRAHRVKHVSTAPQTLPEWNKNAGGIKAFYFRDPEDHVLEIIFFPPGKGDPKWQPSSLHSAASGRRTGDPLFLGIDHTAIVVRDTDRSLDFYRDALGLRVAGGSENYGIEQEHLNQVFGARLRITALRAGRGPGIEFLEYLTPPGGRPLPEDATASDLVFWNTHLAVNDLSTLSARLREGPARLVSPQIANTGGETGIIRASLIVRDPDGHALQLDEVSAESVAPARGPAASVRHPQGLQPWQNR